MKQRLCVIALISAMIFSLCACSHSTESEASLPTSITTTTPASTTTTTTETTISSAGEETTAASSADTTATTTTVTTSATSKTSAKSTAVTTTTTGSGVVDAGSDAAKAIDRAIRNYGYTSAVYLYSFEKGVLYSHNANTMILGASLIKLPYAYYCCMQIEAGVRSADEMMTYTEDFYHGGAGIIRKGAYGTQYSLGTLIDYSLRYSDNVAYDMLVAAFGISDFNAMIRQWGYSVSISQYTRFPSVNASFMKCAMEKMHAKSADGAIWQTAWTALNESVLSYARDTIGGENEIAVKYGQVETSYHEVLYVDGEHPYILVILTKTSDYIKPTAFVQKIAANAAALAAEATAEETTVTTTETTSVISATFSAIETTTPAEPQTNLMDE